MKSDPPRSARQDQRPSTRQQHSTSDAGAAVDRSRGTTGREAEPAGSALFALLTAMGDAVLVVDRDWRIRAHNAPADHLLAPSAAIGTTLWEAWPMASAPDLAGPLRRAMDAGDPVQLTVHPSKHADRDVQLDVRAAPLETGLAIVARESPGPSAAADAHESRIGRLQQLTAALSAALDPAAVGRAIIAHATPALGANAANVYLLEEDGAALLSVARWGYDPAVWESSRRLPLTSPTLVADVVRAGEPVIFTTWEERLAHYPHHRSVHARDGDRAVAGLPLKVEGRTIGALSLAFPTDRAFEPDDRQFMATVADLCAQALERARLYEVVRRNEAHVRLVADRAPAALFHCDTDLRYLFVSRAYAAWFGLTPEQIIGKSLDEVLGAAAFETLREFVEIALDGEEAEFEAVAPFATIGLRYVEGAFVPDRDERGQVRGLVGMMTDATERQRATLGRQLLADATAILGQSLDPETTLADVTRAAVPGFADMCITYLLDRAHPRRVAVVHGDPAQADLIHALQQRQPVTLEAPVGIAQVLRTGKPELLATIPASFFTTATRDEEDRRLVTALRPQSALTVPLRTNDRVVGAMQFLMTDPARRFDADDLWLAEELARRCATAIENSRLFRSLQESEAHFRQLADAMPQIVWVSSGDGASLESLNQRWFAYTGANPARASIRQATALIHPDDRRRVGERWAEAMRTGEPLSAEVRLRAADGAYRWFLSRAVPVRDASGEIVKWFGTATDIDDAERAAASQRFLAGLGRTLAGSLNPEETLRRVARLLVPMLGDDCYVDLLEPSGEIRRVAWAHVDPAAERQFAESPARFVPRVLHREHPIARAIDSGEAQILSDMDDAWLERIAFSPEHLAFMRRRRYRSQLTLPLRARGRTLGVLTVCHAADSSRQYTPDQVDLVRDVAERIALAVDNALLYSEARQAEAKVRRVLDAGVVGVILTADDRVVEANDHFLAMIGATRAELDRGDLRWPAMTPATYAALDTAALAELEERGSVTPYEKQFIRRDGTLVPVLVGSAELQREPRQNIGFVLDLTEQKRAEDEWRAFIDSTAHDLRNPLTAVLGQTQLLQRRLRRQGTIDPSDADARLAAIASGSRRAARLIDDLIDTARLRAGQPLEFHPSPVDLAALATACVEEVRRVARTHHVKVEAESPRLIVAADGPRIERVIRNMLDNAIKYSPDGGEVVVRARREEDGRGRWAILEVEDHGLGIPAADLPHVFDRFRRGGNVAGRIEGSGIGLTGARPLIEQHGGTIDVASAEGAGSTFRLRLPLLTDRA